MTVLMWIVWMLGLGTGAEEEVGGLALPNG